MLGLHSVHLCRIQKQVQSAPALCRRQGSSQLGAAANKDPASGALEPVTPLTSLNGNKDGSLADHSRDWRSLTWQRTFWEERSQPGSNALAVPRFVQGMGSKERCWCLCTGCLNNSAQHILLLNCRRCQVKKEPPEDLSGGRGAQRRV